MKRVLQEKNHPHSANSRRRVAQGKFPQNAAQDGIATRLDNSPLMLAQRKKLQSLFGGAAQLQEESAPKPNRTGLPDNLKSGIEHLSGMSMDHVKVHYNSSQPAQLNALAYAQGHDIHIAPGQEKHLPHEAWHVVQQAQGRVRPTMQMKGGEQVNDDKSLEREADAMGEMAQRQRDATSSKSLGIRLVNNSAPIQRVIKVGDTRISKYTYKSQLINERAVFKDDWNNTPEEIQKVIMGMINDDETHQFASWSVLVASLGGENNLEIIEEPKWKEIEWGYATLNVRILSDKGGYHQIWEVKELPNYVVRAPKKGATPIKLGLQNWSKLSQLLNQYNGLARVPEILNVDTAELNNAYIVERISHTVDALELWNMLETTQDQTIKERVRNALLTISSMFQENIRRMLYGEKEPYPDFRPSNVGVKGGDSTLIYIDFDQPPIAQDHETLKAHAMEWAGRRFMQDEGGSREPNEKLWEFLTGGMLGSMEGAKNYL